MIYFENKVLDSTLERLGGKICTVFFISILPKGT